MTGEQQNVNWVCATCGSDDVLFDAFARWNTVTQAFELSSVMDSKGHYCNACDDERRMEEVVW